MNPPEEPMAAAQWAVMEEAECAAAVMVEEAMAAADWETATCRNNSTKHFRLNCQANRFRENNIKRTA
jgi:hypothetical protein